MFFIFFGILLLIEVFIYIWLLHKHNRKLFYGLSILINILLGFFAYMGIGNAEWGGLLVAFCCIGLYILFALFAVIFECLNKPSVLAGRPQKFKVILALYALVPLAMFFPTLGRMGISFSLYLILLFGFVVFTYHLLVKSSRNFYIAFLVSTLSFIPICFLIEKVYYSYL